MPGGWLEIEPGTARHGLWGVSDRLLVDGAQRALCAAQPWEAVRGIPALDRPAALPPGAGEVALNLIASLAVDQGRPSLHYRGPYPTAHLFSALSRSFRPEPNDTGARERFCRDELTLAWHGTLAGNPVAWTPDPFAAASPAPGLLLRRRLEVETLWIGTVPFRRQDPAGRMTAGPRLWMPPHRGQERLNADLVLLSEPYRCFVVLDRGGRLLEDLRDEPPSDHGVEPGASLDPLWRDVLCAWCSARAPLPIAEAVLALRETLPLRWAALPYSLVAREQDTILVQSGLGAQFRALRSRRPAAELALMALSDLATGVAPHLLALAQQTLAERERPASLEALLEAGRHAQGSARRLLEASAPRLVRSLAQGRLLDEDVEE